MNVIVTTTSIIMISIIVFIIIIIISIIIIIIIIKRSKLAPGWMAWHLKAEGWVKYICKGYAKSGFWNEMYKIHDESNKTLVTLDRMLITLGCLSLIPLLPWSIIKSTWFHSRHYLSVCVLWNFVSNVITRKMKKIIQWQFVVDALSVLICEWPAVVFCILFANLVLKSNVLHQACLAPLQ